MNQVEKFVSPRPVIGRGFEKPAFVRAAILAALVAAMAIALAAFATKPSAVTPQTASGGLSGVTDGWMLHVPDANAARRQQLASQVTDGWALSFLTANRQAEVTDGWAGRYLPSARGD